MTDPFVAEIRMFGFNFAPTGWAMCNGQLLPISQNTALFSLLGTTYGGNGQSTFALPDLQGSVPMHPGQGPGLSLYDLGQSAGSDSVTLIDAEIPVHTHAITTSQADATSQAAAGEKLASGIGLAQYGAVAGLTSMAPESLAGAGADLPHNNLQPYLVMNFCIALQGIFPPRS